MATGWSLTGKFITTANCGTNWHRSATVSLLTRTLKYCCALMPIGVRPVLIVLMACGPLHYGTTCMAAYFALAIVLERSSFIITRPQMARYGLLQKLGLFVWPLAVMK